MPLIVKGDGGLVASYKDRDLVRQFYDQPQEPSETTPLNPHKSDVAKLHRRIQMRRFCITCLVLAEIFERFAYYGIVINLALFLDNFGWSMFATSSTVLVYTAMAWFMCALGGIMADSSFGRYSTIVAGFVVYFIGALALVGVSIWIDIRKQHLELGPEQNLPILPWLAVVLLSIGVGEGAVKANLSTFSAEQLKGEPPTGASKGFFNCFYWISNVLALSALTGVTYVQQTRFKWSSGFTFGFAIPVLSLTFAAAAFLVSSKYFVVDGPHGTGLRNIWMIVNQAWSKRHEKDEIRELTAKSPIRHSHGKLHWLDKATVQFGGTFLKSEVYEARFLGKAFLFSLTLIPYWIVYSQLYSTYILQGLHLMSGSSKFVIPAAWMSLTETAVVLLTVPIMERAVYPMCTQCNLHVPRLWRVAFGMLLAAASSGMAGYVEMSKAKYYHENGYINQTTSCRVYKVVQGYSIFNQIPQYALLGMSEIFASMSGLEIVYTTCPTTVQSVTSGLYNIMISIGSILSLVILAIASCYDWYPLHIENDIDYLKNEKTAYYYWVLSIVVLVNVLVLSLVGYCCDIGVRQPHRHHHRHSYENGSLSPNSTGDSMPADEESTSELQGNPVINQSYPTIS